MGVKAPVSRTSVVTKAFETEIGAQQPLGFWDPLGLLENADQDRFDRLREVELKHGRVSMLAVLGHITTTGHPSWRRHRPPRHLVLGHPVWFCWPRGGPAVRACADVLRGRRS